MLRPFVCARRPDTSHVTGLILLGIVGALSTTVVMARQTPVAAMYSGDQVRDKTLSLGFQTSSIPSNAAASFPAQVYLTMGDLQRAFDDSTFRPDAAIVPTNTDLQLTAPSPATQRVLIDRVQKQPAVMKALQDQVDARRASGSRTQAGILEIGIDAFVANLTANSGDGSDRSAGAFPQRVCFVATDFASGGAIDRRELFAQDRLRRGIAGCLTALDAAGAQSVVVPLVGAASSGTQSRDPSYEGQRVLMECRLINAVAGIALGIHDFAPARRRLREIGVIQWEQEILGMFGATRGAPMSRSAQTAFRTYTNQVKLALRNGLAGQKTTSIDVSGSCTGILNAQPAR